VRALLTTMLKAGFPPEDAVRYARTLLWFTLGFVSTEHSLFTTSSVHQRIDGDGGAHRLTVDLGPIPPDWAEPAAELLPHLAILDVDDLFDSSIDRFLDGLERELARAEEGPGLSPGPDGREGEPPGR
jgi:hypothetical protein